MLKSHKKIGDLMHRAESEVWPANKMKLASQAAKESHKLIGDLLTALSQ